MIDTGDGVLLRPKSPFRVTDISEVASCLEYSGEAKSVDEMEAASATSSCREFLTEMIRIAPSPYVMIADQC